jgi:DNA repair exonuclease SbcCD nuclease subunit
MKILFSADWHIKLGTKNIPDSWAINRYRLLFKELHKLEKQVDIHIIGGDIFDRLPKMEELQLYFEFIRNCTIPTYIFSGNHEALKKNTTFLTHLKDVTNGLNTKVEIVDNFYSIDNIDIIPYNKLKESWPSFNNKILFTHVRGEIPPHVKPEIDLDLFNRWEKVYAGDLHSNSNSQRNIIYPGSPVTTSFHRERVNTGVLVIDTDTLTEEWVSLQVPQLIRETIKVGDPLIAGEYDLIIYEVEGNISELHTVGESVLIDKKISRRSSDTALMLGPDMSIEEELVEYLQYILNIPENAIEGILKEYSDNIKNS